MPCCLRPTCGRGFRWICVSIASFLFFAGLRLRIQLQPQSALPAMILDPTVRPSGMDVLLESQVVILDWNPYQHFPAMSNAFLMDCPDLDRRCSITADRSRLAEAHALVFRFNFDHMHWDDLPQFRFPWQLYVAQNREPPAHTYGLDTPLARGFFNWTMTHRRDSDVYWPYAQTVPLSGSRPGVDTNPLTPEAFARKSKMVAWFVSNCNAHSQREHYVEQLSRYLQVDRFGRCTYTKCPLETKNQCFKMLQEDYKFYIAFENNVCRDYLTEKVWSGFELRLNYVPIVLTRSIAEGILPPNSFIAADDFASPRDLAEFLIELAKDYERYAAYFEWRKHYRVNSESEPGHDLAMCDLCQKLIRHTSSEEERRTKKVYEDIYAWWFNETVCDNQFVSRVLDRSIPNASLAQMLELMWL